MTDLLFWNAIKNKRPKSLLEILRMFKNQHLPSLLTKVKKVLKLFQRIDKAVEQFQKHTNLKCRPGCGR